MYIELDLDHNAVFVIGYVLCVALVVKMVVAISKKDKKGKK